MTVKLVAMFERPPDPAAFDAEYFGTHLPLNAKTPGLRRTEVTRVTGAPRGESPWYLVTEMYYDDDAALQSALQSEAAAEAGKNLMSFAKGLVTMYTAEVVEEQTLSRGLRPGAASGADPGLTGAGLQPELPVPPTDSSRLEEPSDLAAEHDSRNLDTENLAGDDRVVEDNRG